MEENRFAAQHLVVTWETVLDGKALLIIDSEGMLNQRSPWIRCGTASRSQRSHPDFSN